MSNRVIEKEMSNTLIVLSFLSMITVFTVWYRRSYMLDYPEGIASIVVLSLYLILIVVEHAKNEVLVPRAIHQMLPLSIGLLKWIWLVNRVTDAPSGFDLVDQIYWVLKQAKAGFYFYWVITSAIVWLFPYRVTMVTLLV